MIAALSHARAALLVVDIQERLCAVMQEEVLERVVKNTRGSTFSLCQRSKTEPERYPRYPRLPVARCPGYERSTGTR